MTDLPAPVLAWQSPASAPVGWRVLLPLSGAALRRLAQTLSKAGLVLWPNPFAATLIGYTVSGVGIWGARLAVHENASHGFRAAALPWFMAAGILNGGALLLLYHALQTGRVAVVAPLVALYPLFTMVFSAALLKTEVLTRRTVLGAVLAVSGVVVLIAG